MSRRGWLVGRRLRQRRVLADLHRPSPQTSNREKWWPRLVVAAAQSWQFGPRQLTAAVLVLAGAVTAVAGPMAGALTAGYVAVAARTFYQHRIRQADTAARADLLEQLTIATSNLRAGLPPATALATGPPAAPPSTASTITPLSIAATAAAPSTSEAVQRLQHRISAAVRLAERTGAPLAEVIERLEIDARSVDWARAAAAGQVAGARATTWLLAALPLGGIGLGYAIGADPLSVLLHTPLGAACALVAFGLQLSGLAWSARITRLDRHLPS